MVRSGCLIDAEFVRVDQAALDGDSERLRASVSPEDGGEVREDVADGVWVASQCLTGPLRRAALDPCNEHGELARRRLGHLVAT